MARVAIVTGGTKGLLFRRVSVRSTDLRGGDMEAFVQMTGYVLSIVQQSRFGRLAASGSTLVRNAGNPQRAGVSPRRSTLRRG